SAPSSSRPFSGVDLSDWHLSLPLEASVSTPLDQPPWIDAFRISPIFSSPPLGAERLGEAGGASRSRRIVSSRPSSVSRPCLDGITSPTSPDLSAPLGRRGEDYCLFPTTGAPPLRCVLALASTGRGFSFADITQSTRKKPTLDKLRGDAAV